MANLGSLKYLFVALAFALTLVNVDLLSAKSANAIRASAGGLERGSSTLIAGPAGAGKSSIACAYAVTAAQHNELSAFFIFDESKSTLVVIIFLRDRCNSGLSSRN